MDNVTVTPLNLFKNPSLPQLTQNPKALPTPPAAFVPNHTRPGSTYQTLAKADAMLDAGVLPAAKAAPAAIHAPAAPAPQADPYFKFTGVPHVDHSKSIMWTAGSKGESPTQANLAITEGYKRLNKGMQDYLLGDPSGPKLPPLSDWTTFGKYASREAGEQIRNLEDVKRAQAGDKEAAARVARNMADLNSAQQVGQLGLAAAKQNFGSINPLKAVLDPLGQAGGALGGTISDAAISGPDKMLGALVKGNNGIYNNFAPAYEAFLSGEASGKGGLKALAEAGYTPGSKLDPQGFFTAAMTDYKEARELGIQAQKETDPAKRAQLLSQRQQLMERGNLNLGNQEQVEVIQQKDVFGDPTVSKNIEALGGTMSIHDANGEHKLLPKGGNWADFKTRMGYKDVDPGTPGAMKINLPDGTTHYFAVDPTAKGTISDYFTGSSSGEAADRLNRGNPKALFSPTVSASGTLVDEAARNLNKGRPVSATVAGASGAVAGTGELGTQAGKTLTASGQNDTRTGQAVKQVGKAQGGVRGFATTQVGNGMQAVGAVKTTGGRVLQDAGKKTTFAAGVVNELWKMANGR